MADVNGIPSRSERQAAGDIRRDHRQTPLLSPDERDVDAAAWVLRELDVEPTNKLAAAVFDTTEARVSKARRLLEQRGRRHNGGGHHNCKPVSTLTDREVDRLVEQVGAELVEKLGAEACLRFLDRATQPELPLRAAE
jgi:hypothetical protein